MGHLVFLRAANVGGRNVFRPADLARSLEGLDVVNVGAAGTFVVWGKASPATIRREILALLPFEPALAVIPAREVLALVDSRPFDGVSFSKDMPGKAWSVRFERLEGPFALGLWRRRRGRGGFVFPGYVVEKAVGVPATTRWWETVERAAGLCRRPGD